MFSGTQVDALAVIFIITGALGIIIVWREIVHQQKIDLLRHEIIGLKAEITALQNVILRHFPGEQLALRINGGVHDSTIETAGRDVRNT